MKKKNPFIYSLDNKRYHTWNYYLKTKYQHKVFKVPLNAAFSCPNRDGTCGVGGCTFCGALGSGEYAGNIQDDLLKQFNEVEQVMLRKWPNGQPFAYFQAYTNTYAPLPTLKQVFTPFIEMNHTLGLCIGTRADCLEDDKIAYLESLTDKKEVWIELGLQSAHDSTAKHINRGHDFATFVDCINRLKDTHLKICVHIINSLPHEDEKMMLDTIKKISHLPIHAVKIHMLHVCKDTAMEKELEETPFPILTKEEYIDIVIKQLELLPPEIIIQRLTGDAVKELLIEPTWTLNKTIILNDIDKEMVKRNTWQGKYYK